MTALRVLWLAMELCAAHPTAPVTCGAHAYHAVLAADVAGVQPRSVLAIAIVESNLRPDVISRTRRHCGVLQAMGRGHSCRKLLSLATGYAAGGRELRAWMRTCDGEPLCVLGGHGFGNAGAARCERIARCRRYVQRVGRWYRRLER